MNLKRIMKRAHQIRVLASFRFTCKASEIDFGACLRQAWAESRRRVYDAIAKKHIDCPKAIEVCERAGFVFFMHRPLGTHAGRTIFRDRYWNISEASTGCAAVYAAKTQVEAKARLERILASMSDHELANAVRRRAESILED